MIDLRFIFCPCPPCRSLSTRFFCPSASVSGREVWRFFAENFGSRPSASSHRERKMRTNFFCTSFLNAPRGPGHPGKIPGTSQIPLFETQGRQTFEGEHELFGHDPFAWKTPTSPGGLWTQKVHLCALFSYLIKTHPNLQSPV